MFDEDRELEYKLAKGAGTNERTASAKGPQRPAVAETDAKNSAPAPKSAKMPESDSPLYKGTKGKLITTFPE